MQRPRRLVIVRHAESARNAAKKGSVYYADEEARSTIRGVPDYKMPLTGRGVEQARQTGAAIRERYGVFGYVYHSGYLRTVQTADGILAAYTEAERAAMKVRSNAFVRERDPGYTYDMLQDEAEAAFPWLNDHWRTFGGFFARPPGGESLADVANRVYDFLGMLFRDRVGDDVLVVTHGGALRCIRFLLEHWDYERALTWAPESPPANCGVTEYKYEAAQGRLVLQSFNRVYWTLPAPCGPADGPPPGAPPLAPGLGLDVAAAAPEAG